MCTKRCVFRRTLKFEDYRTCLRALTVQKKKVRVSMSQKNVSKF